MRERVIEELQLLRPALQADGGDIELVEVDDEGVVKVRLTGACGGCPMSQLTLSQGVERHLKARIPQLRKVVAVPPGVSE